MLGFKAKLGKPQLTELKVAEPTLTELNLAEPTLTELSRKTNLSRFFRFEIK